MKSLKDIFDKHKCDKGTRRHRYDRVYEPALKHLQDAEFNMLEVGILKGESLESHIDFFTKGDFYSIDIFGRVPSEEVPILENDRVMWCNCNSIEGPNELFAIMAGGNKFDVIIDDGLHTHDSQRQTFENFIPYLKDDGVYFIEDVWPFDKMTTEQKQHPWVQKHNADYTDEKYAALLETIEPYNVTFHDLREGFHPDTFIIEIRNDTI